MVCKMRKALLLTCNVVSAFNPAALETRFSVALSSQTSPRAQVVNLVNISTEHRDALANFMEESVDWTPVTETLRHAVRSADPRLLPGEEMHSPPSLPKARPSFMQHEKRRYTWALRVAYFGPAFRGGYAKHPEYPLETVEGRIRDALQLLHAGVGHARGTACAGRTDAGVSALGQLFSFVTHSNFTAEDLHAAIDGAAPDGELRLLSATRVPREYHATFSTRWRRYVYLLPIQGLGISCDELSQQFEPLVGTPRDYAALGRGLPKGKNTTCLLQSVIVSVVSLPMLENSANCSSAFRIEIVGNRFLRRSVRTLVSSAVLAAQLQQHSSGSVSSVGKTVKASSLLLDMIASGDQKQTAHPAPPQALVLASAGMDELKGDAGVGEEFVHAVFAYGTLRGDFSATGDKWGVLRSTGGSWQAASVSGYSLYQDMRNLYPFAVKTGHDDALLFGTLLQWNSDTSQKAIEQCDRIEGFDPGSPEEGLYRRAVVNVEVVSQGDKKRVPAFIYHLFLSDLAAKRWRPWATRNSCLPPCSTGTRPRAVLDAPSLKGVSMTAWSIGQLASCSWMSSTACILQLPNFHQCASMIAKTVGSRTRERCTAEKLYQASRGHRPAVTCVS